MLIFLLRHWCSVWQPRSVDLPSRPLSDTHLVRLVVSKPGQPGLLRFHLGYPSNNDIKWCGYWDYFCQQKTHTGSAHCIRLRPRRSHLITFGNSTVLRKPFLNVWISLPSIAIIFSSGYRLDKRLTTLAYDITVSSCRLSTLDDRVKRI